jgi:hypothetical membrane protein
MSARLRPHPIDTGPRVAGGLALGSTAVILAGALATGLGYSGPAGEAYSPLNHFISELGQVSQSRLAPVYDAGIVMGALGLGLFLAILSRHLTNRFRSAMLAAAAIAGASGMLTGLLPMDIQPAHQTASAVFFLTGWTVAATFSVWLLGRPRPGFSRWLLLPGLGCIPFFVAFVAVYAAYRPADPYAPILLRSAIWAVPLLEWAALLSLLAWVLAVALVLVRLQSWPEA